MVKFIDAERTLPLRSEVLRGGLPFAECIFPNDEELGAFHLGYFVEDDLVGVVTFFPKSNSKVEGIAYQLRGMAIKESHQGKGFGKKLIDFAKTQLHVTSAQFIWCNARSSAKRFYEGLGFKLISEEFIIEGVGPHFEMLLSLEN